MKNWLNNPSVDDAGSPIVTFKVDSSRVISKVLIVCILIEALLFLADVIINYDRLTEISSIRRLFNLAREGSLGSLFGVMQTYMLGLTLLCIYWVKRQLISTKMVRAGWLFLALFFLYMAIDDGAQIHERVGNAFSTTFSGGSAEGSLGHSIREFYPSYGWQVVFMPIFIGIGLFMLYFLWHEFRDPKALLYVVAGLGVLAFAVVLDFFEGLDKDHHLNVIYMIKESYDLGDYTVNHFQKIIEETLEMLGTTFIWVAFLQYLMAQTAEMRIQFSPSRSEHDVKEPLIKS